MRVLITGGCGLIGYHTAKYFQKKGHEVIVYDNLERQSLLGHSNTLCRVYNKNLLESSGIEVESVDVSEIIDLASSQITPKFDAIIHLAAQCGVPTSINNPRRDMEINLLGTFNILEYARIHGSKVAFASTNKVYPITNANVPCFLDKDGDTKYWRFESEGLNKRGFPKTEGLIGSRTPYGWSKYSADQLCQEYYHTYGVNTGVFRMSCIYGTHQFGFEEQGWATWFAIACAKDQPITIYGDGNQVRDMLYVSDCVQAYYNYITSDIEHGVWNLGGGPDNTLTLLECLDLLSQFSGKSFENISFEDWRPCDQKVYVSDIRSAQSDLNWDVRVKPEVGMKLVYDWVSENQEIF